MIKFIFFILTLSPGFLFGQMTGKWRAGSANELKGKIYTMACFVSDDEDDWSYDQKAEALKKLDEAQNWLIEKADSYGVKLKFKVGYLGLGDDIELRNIERGTASGNERVDWVSLVLRPSGYQDNRDLFEWVKTNTECEQLVVVIFVKGEGNSYSMPESNEMDAALYYVEGAVIYEKYWNGNDLAASTISHEMCHLFGAWDLYKTYAQTQEKEDSARAIFPDDIMLRTSYDFSELDVYELTAWLVGWNIDYKEWFGWFRPSDIPE